MQKAVVVLGLGNVLMSDEGIGVHVLRELNKSADTFPQVDFIEAGSSMINVVHAIRHKKKAFLIDCAYMDEQPGAIRKFEPENVVSKRIFPTHSSHEGDLLQLLQLSRNLGEYPDSVSIFGIQPECVKIGDRLSRKLAESLEYYARVIASELA